VSLFISREKGFRLVRLDWCGSMLGSLKGQTSAIFYWLKRCFQLGWCGSTLGSFKGLSYLSASAGGAQMSWLFVSLN